MPELKINRLRRGECLERWLIGRSVSIFHFLGRRYAEGEIIKAAAGEDEKYTPFYVQAPANWKIDTPAFFWLNKEKKELIVDQQYFSALTVVNALNPPPKNKEKLLIGKFFSDHLFLTKRQLVELLLRAEVIQTYVHIEAELCLKEEREKDGVYTAVFHGKHIYYTNEGVTEEYDFAVMVDWNKEEIFLAGASL